MLNCSLILLKKESHIVKTIYWQIFRIFELNLEDTCTRCEK